MGTKCHFAHGQEDLRTPNDPLPPNTPYINDPKLSKNQNGTRENPKKGGPGGHYDPGILSFTA